MLAFPIRIRQLRYTGSSTGAIQNKNSASFIPTLIVVTQTSKYILFTVTTHYKSMIINLTKLSIVFVFLTSIVSGKFYKLLAN